VETKMLEEEIKELELLTAEMEKEK